jgi:hypothetical protein
VYHQTQPYVLVERSVHFADRHGPLTKTAPGDMEEAEDGTNDR